jgi:hypothetical protein
MNDKTEEDDDHNSKMNDKTEEDDEYTHMDR